MSDTQRTITNRELIEQLQKFPLDAPVEFSVSQYNKVYPTFLQLGVTRFSPVNSKNQIVDFLNGHNLHIHLSMPDTDDTYFIISSRKK